MTARTLGLGLAAALTMLPGAAHAAPGTTCRPATQVVAAGTSAVTVALDCRVASGGRARWVAHGRTGGGQRAITGFPAHGTVDRLNAATGRARYRPDRGAVGTDRIAYRVTLPGGRKLTGTLTLRLSAASTPTRPEASAPSASEPPAVQAAPAAPEPPTPAAGGGGVATPPPDTSGIPPLLPLVPASVAASTRAWAPTALDTCPATLHDRFSVVGPDGKRYPTWHPPTVVNPATGAECTFGHEHGLDPHTSDIFGWVAAHMAAGGYEGYAGVPFGLATEALETWSTDHGTPKRGEDNPGYKVDVENDVRLLAADGTDLGVTCDYLVMVHQGSHSADATMNNVHELLYASRCSDGTEIISDVVSRFGTPGQYTRACDPATTVTTTNNGYPTGTGSRSIPDRTCVQTSFLVPAGRTTSAWALYEKWQSANALHESADGSGQPLATYNTGFGVFNPARYADPSVSAGLRRSLDLCWEVLPNGNRAHGVECDEATEHGAIATPYAYNDLRSPYNGTYRDVYLDGPSVRNAAGATRWYTDPYGNNASTTPFPGAVCQLVGRVDTTSRPDVAVQIFGRNRDPQTPGVHAPN